MAASGDDISMAAMCGEVRVCGGRCAASVGGGTEVLRAVPSAHWRRGTVGRTDGGASRLSI